jgi:hypothetical protein
MWSKVLGFLSGDVLDSLASLFKDYQEKKITKEELKFKLATFEAQNEQDLRLAQIALNAEEAKHSSMFVAGWRPFLGWVCGLGFTMNFLVAPIGTFFAELAGYSIVFPQADVSTMMPVLLGMLGLGGMRTIEKLNYRARNNLEG